MSAVAVAEDLTGLVGIVTGAAGGIGRAATLRLAQGGATVLAVDRDGEAVASLAAGASGVVAHHADVTDAESVAGFVRRARDELGGVDMFFNNAGIGGAHAPIVDLEDDAWQRCMAINLTAVFLGLKHVMRAMEASGKGGSIVNTGSILSFKAAPGRVDYTVSKHGVAALTRTAAAEGGRHGIRVNCICPGPIDTALQQASERIVRPEDPAWERRRLESGTPLGRYGTADEVAETVAFLLSPRVPYLTGALVSLDGGITAT